MRIHLKKEERQYLFHKYKKSGLSDWESQERLDKFIDFLNNLVLKLKAKNKSDEEIEKRFREEFEKLCQSLEL